MSDFIYKEYSETVSQSEKCYEILTKYKCALLGSDPGAGKTFTSIRSIYLFDKNAIILLFAAPVSKLESKDWENSVTAFNKAMNSNIEIYGFSYPTLYSKNPKKIKEINDVLLKAKSENRKLYIIADEAQKLKINSSATYSKTNSRFLELSKSELVHKILFLTGTSIANSYIDVAFMLIVAGFYRNITDFRKQQIKFFDDKHQPIIKDPYTKKIDKSYFKDPDLIEYQIKEILVYTDTSHIMPEYEHFDIKITLDDTHQYIHQGLLKKFNDNTMRTGKEHIKAIRKYQTQGYYENIPSVNNDLRIVCQNDINKLKKLGYYLYELFNKKEEKDIKPVLIFYQFDIERDNIIEFITKHFPNLIIKQINGKKKDSTYNLDPNTVVLIQYVAGGAAIEFKDVQVNIFYGPPLYSYIDYKQAQGRARRARGKNKIYYLNFKLTKTIEEQIWNYIENKEEFVDSVKINWDLVDGG